MNRLPVALLFLVTWLAVFAQTQFPMVHDWLGVPPSVVPALLVYAALTHELVVALGFAVTAAVWLDALSASRFGVSLLPMAGFVYLVQTRSHLILREQRFAQFWLGAVGGVAIPLVTVGLLQLGRRQPAVTGGTVWQLLVLGLGNGFLAPLTFRLFDRLNRTFNYQVSAPQSFRSDREIVRGRH